jgi:hypothetical protein
MANILTDTEVDRRSEKSHEVYEGACLECEHTESKLSAISNALFVGVLITCPQNVELFKTFRMVGLDCEFGCPLNL